MADHNATLGTVSATEKVIAVGAGPHTIRSYLLGALAAALSAGTVMALDKDEQLVPYDEDIVSSIGLGDGAETDFSDVLGPLKPGSVSITDGTETFTDDGFGTLTGSAGGSGKVDYSDGRVAVSFNAAPALDADIAATYRPSVRGVLMRDVGVDDADADVCVFGNVNRNELLVGGAAASADVLARLDRDCIWPVG